MALTSVASNLATLTAVPLLGSWLATALADSSRSRTAFALSKSAVARPEKRSGASNINSSTTPSSAR